MSSGYPYYSGAMRTSRGTVTVCAHEEYDTTNALSIHWRGHPVYASASSLVERTRVFWMAVPCQRTHFTYFGTVESLDKNHRHGDFKGIVEQNRATGTAEASLWMRCEDGFTACIWRQLYRPDEAGSQPYEDVMTQYERLLIDCMGD